MKFISQIVASILVSAGLMILLSVILVPCGYGHINAINAFLVCFFIVYMVATFKESK